MKDYRGRTIDYARISITDRCNLRCIYCMPEDGITTLAHGDILTFEEILTIAKALSSLGIRYIKITGGEPMARKGCISLIKQLKAVPGIDEVTMTTNGVLLAGVMQEAADAGLDGINISLDTLDENQFTQMTRLGELSKTLSTIHQALEMGIPSVKINVVPVKGINEASMVPLAGMAREKPIHVRFIELMPVGCGAAFESISQEDIKAGIEAVYGPLERDPKRRGNGPASYYRLKGFQGSIGFISALSHEFCDQCNRVRITADGQLKLCLNHRVGIDLKQHLRSGASAGEIARLMREAILNKPQNHAFKDMPEDKEERRMFQIGG